VNILATIERLLKAAETSGRATTLTLIPLLFALTSCGGWTGAGNGVGDPTDRNQEEQPQVDQTEVEPTDNRKKTPDFADQDPPEKISGSKIPPQDITISDLSGLEFEWLQDEPADSFSSPQTDGSDRPIGSQSATTANTDCSEPLRLQGECLTSMNFADDGKTVVLVFGTDEDRIQINGRVFHHSATEFLIATPQSAETRFVAEFVIKADGSIAWAGGAEGAETLSWEPSSDETQQD